MPSHPFAGRGLKNGGGDSGCRGGDGGMPPIFRPDSVAPTNSGHFAKGYIAVIVVQNERRGPLEGANEVAEE
jgi:hypothetical protein